MGVQFLLLLGLGRPSKQAGDEGPLLSDVSFAHPCDLSLAKHVHDLVAQDAFALPSQRKRSPSPA